LYNIEVILQCTYVASNVKFHLTLLLRSNISSTTIFPNITTTLLTSTISYSKLCPTRENKLSILLNIVTMWGNIVINNAKITSSFKCGPLLISFNVKRTWSLAWKLFMVNPCLISSSSIMLYQACYKFKSYLNLSVFGLYHPWNIW